MKKTMLLTLVTVFALCPAICCFLAATASLAEDGYVTNGVKKGVDVTVGGTKKGIDAGVSGTKKGIDVTVGGTKKGLRTAGGGIKKGVKETKKFFRKVF